MTRLFSIRARLTAWYVAVLAVATITVATGSWWLFRRSAITAADNSLAVRLQSVQHFVQSMEHELGPNEVLDEFREYGQLTAGDSLLEVIDAAGTVLCQPSVPGWSDLKIRPGEIGNPRFADKSVAGRPFRVVGATLEINARRYAVTAAIPMGPIDAALARFRWLLVLAMPLVVLLTAVGGWWISGRALVPVDRMTRSVQAISLRNLDRRLEVPAAEDELRRLAVTFNDMLTRLQTAVADMVRFTAEASHELKTPVSLVRATAEVTLSRERPAHEYRQALSDILDQSERMSALVNDLLALARVDAGVEPPTATLVDLSAVARDVSRDVQTSMDRRSLTFDKALTPGAVVRGSAESFRRVMLILLENAVKYTPERGCVGLRVATMPSKTAGAADTCVVEVTDNGVGIEPSERSRVFDRFYRGAAARQQSDGSGLGLSIARAVIERHGGTVALESGPDGRGTRITVLLPQAPG
jgi:heavy metal sensor kinase